MKCGEVDRNHWMLNMLAKVVCPDLLKVTVGHISLMSDQKPSVRQYVVPRAVLRRSGTRYGFVPLVGSFELRVQRRELHPGSPE